MTALTGGLFFLQAFGAIVGTISVIWAEVSYVHAMRDGHIDAAERQHLRFIGHGLRFGMTALLVASFGISIIAYMGGAALQPALSTTYWMLIALVVTILAVSSALARGKLGFALGSAIVLTAWWFLSYLTLGYLPAMTFGAALALFVVASGVLYAVIFYARSVLITPLKAPLS